MTVSAAGQRTLARLAAAALVAVLGASCGVRGLSLGTTSSACFHAIPTAADAVRHQGSLLGVRLVEARRLRRLPEHAELGSGKVCLVAYKGRYGPAAVEHPLTQDEGPFAVVAVSSDGRRLLGSDVVRRLPLTFRHRV